MARKPAKMYRRVKGPSFTRRKYMGGVPNNRILQFHTGNRRAAETGASRCSSSSASTMRARFATQHSKPPVSSRARRFERPPDPKATPCASTPIHIRCFERTSKPLEQGRTVCPRACDRPSARTWEPPLGSPAIRSLSASVATQHSTSSHGMHCAGVHEVPITLHELITGHELVPGLV